MKKLSLMLIALAALTAQAQLRNDDICKLPEMNKNVERDVIRIPDIDGYKTLKCDLHIHTVFSDGSVWPNVRVDEAWMQGLDAIAITDHIEVRPRKETLAGDLNESYKIAKKHGDNIGFIVIQGTEITRKKPLGHLNALFINDANVLDIEDPLKAIDIARNQGAVIMWNHPGWPDNKSTMYDVHKQLLADKKIDIYEVHNHMEYYPLTFEWMNQYDISPTANTDTHNAIMGEFGTVRLNRPMTLVFAKERSKAGIKEALLARRTAAFFHNIIVAKEDWASKLFWASIKYRIVSQNGNSATVEVENVSDIPFTIKESNGDTFVLPANKIIRHKFTAPNMLTVTNIFVGHNKNLTFPMPEE